jgi:hypothetical protein
MESPRIVKRDQRGIVLGQGEMSRPPDRESILLLLTN